MAVRSLAQSSILQNPSVNSMLGDYEGNYFHHLETVRLSSTASSVTFSNLGQYNDYQHLQIRAVTRTDRSTFDRDLTLMRFNNVQTTVYSHHSLTGEGTTVFSNATVSNDKIDLGSYSQAATSTSGAFSVYAIDILDPFETTKNKVTRTISVGTIRSSESGVSLASGLWSSTDAVTSITFYAIGNYVSGSRFSLYGIKARA